MPDPMLSPGAPAPETEAWQANLHNESPSQGEGLSSCKKPENVRFQANCGAPSGARTLGTLIKSQVLYQLS